MTIAEPRLELFVIEPSSRAGDAKLRELLASVPAEQLAKVRANLRAVPFQLVLRPTDPAEPNFGTSPFGSVDDVAAVILKVRQATEDDVAINLAVSPAAELRLRAAVRARLGSGRAAS